VLAGLDRLGSVAPRFDGFYDGQVMRYDGVHHHRRIRIGAHDVHESYGFVERHLAGDLLVRKVLMAA
jgi:hypothetical protein